VSSKEVRAFVDRIEEDGAVLLVGDEGRDAIWPVDSLPQGAREGSVLRVVIRLDEDATRQTEDVVDSLIERLQRGD
jgi:hypothetical protein